MKRFWKKRWLPLPVLIPLLLYAAAAVWTSTRNVSQLPVLMYHHISEDGATDMVISPARFAAHLAALKEHIAAREQAAEEKEAPETEAETETKDEDEQDGSAE